MQVKTYSGALFQHIGTFMNINDEIIKELRKTHHLYILKSWRINVVWLNEFNIEKVVDTLYEVTKGKRLE